ncbi:MAG TPA: LON peptidase substrate-binding domain-containing protein, partial [Thermomicrobiales bacterium]|nr:LON peptidase substrate-binding domain-containing protein [Thermomicrobiales bacterium]
MTDNENRTPIPHVEQEDHLDESVPVVDQDGVVVEPTSATKSDDSDTLGDPEPTIVTIPILPLRGTVDFPLTVVPLAAAQPRSLRLIDEVMSGDRGVGLLLQNDAEMEGAGPNDVRTIGTLGSILQMMRVPDGSVRLAVQGSERMRVIEWLEEEPFLMARVEKIPEIIEESVEVDALMRNTLELFQRLVSLVSHLHDELVTAAINV